MEVTIEHNGIPFKYRGDEDEQSVKYNLNGKQYKQLKLSKEDIVLDLGGHIGTFAVPTAVQVKEVHSIEMDIDNFTLLKFNASEYENLHVYNKACVPEDFVGDNITYYSGKWSSSNSIFQNRNKHVQHMARVVTIQRLLTKFEPTIIKCDIEGAEYDIFEKLTLPECVKQLIFELHLSHKDWREKANKLQENLKSQKFTFEERDLTKFNWYVTLMYFER